MPEPSLKDAIAADFRTYCPHPRGALKFLLTLLLVPGFSLMLHYRLARNLHGRGKIGRLLGLLIWRRSVRVSACYISPLASIGTGLNLPHPTGVVIGEGVRIEAGVTLYQGVTLGTRGGGSYPVIEEGVTIYAGAVVAGGVRIGRGARVGANAFVINDVAPCSTVAGVPARPVGQSARDQRDA